MKAGRLRQRLELQTADATADDYGDEIPGWTTVGTYSASVSPLTGREAANAQQVKAEVTHKIVMRYVGAIVPTQRFLWGTRVLSILWVRNIDERNREYEIYCQEVVATS